jgi:hypothetical protein
MVHHLLRHAAGAGDLDHFIELVRGQHTVEDVVIMVTIKKPNCSFQRMLMDMIFSSISIPFLFGRLQAMAYFKSCQVVRTAIS